MAAAAAAAAERRPVVVTFRPKVASARWPSCGPLPASGAEEIPAKRLAVVHALRHAWRGYEAIAWGSDEMKPLARRGAGGYGLGLMILDALDVLWLAGLKEDFHKGVQWVRGSLNLVRPHTPRTIAFALAAQAALALRRSPCGARPAAHGLRRLVRASAACLPRRRWAAARGPASPHREASIRSPSSRRLSAALRGCSRRTSSPMSPCCSRRRPTSVAASPKAFESPSGLPYTQISLGSGSHSIPSWLGGNVLLAEIGTSQMEFVALAKHTGRKEFRDKALKVFDVLDREGRPARRRRRPPVAHPHPARVGQAARLHDLMGCDGRLVL